VSPTAAKRLLLPTLISLAGAALIGLLVYGLSTQSASRTLDELVATHRYPAAPQAAHRLDLLGAAGSSSLASYRGSVVVLNFWASWCEPCRAEAPLLQRAQQTLQAHGATVLGVSYLDTSPDSEAFVRRYHLTYPELRDTDGEFAHAYGTNQLPESFIVDRVGHVVAISRGEIGQPFVKRAIALAQQSA
jgi:cytochrome c biogenesis protein CcmG, thiol:disulfide interchange protein DsbE